MEFAAYDFLNKLYTIFNINFAPGRQSLENMFPIWCVTSVSDYWRHISPENHRNRSHPAIIHKIYPHVRCNVPHVPQPDPDSNLCAARNRSAVCICLFTSQSLNVVRAQVRQTKVAHRIRIAAQRFSMFRIRTQHQQQQQQQHKTNTEHARL